MFYICRCNLNCLDGMDKMNLSRNYSMDVLRVIACLLVIWQHASEQYYISPDLTPVREASTYMVGVLTSLCRASVPLFVIASGYFILPMRGSVSEFFRRRASRIMGPFLFWSVVYAIYFVFSRGDSWMQCLVNISHVVVNFGTEIGHMWYVYMLIGLYLLVPILSPWLQSVDSKTLKGYLYLWGITSMLSYVHLIFPSLWGECYWNPTPMLYYFTGFIGYFILGFYFKRFGAPGRWVSLLLLVIGYAFTALIFNARIETATDVSSLELSWQQCSGNVALMAIGIFGLIHSFRYQTAGLFARFITNASQKGYAMYLFHMIVLGEISTYLANRWGNVLIEIPLLSILTFLITYLLICALSYLPKSKYWLG